MPVLVAVSHATCVYRGERGESEVRFGSMIRKFGNLLVFCFCFLPKRPMAVGGRTLESGSSARHASRTASEICGVDEMGWVRGQSGFGMDVGCAERASSSPFPAGGSAAPDFHPRPARRKKTPLLCLQGRRRWATRPETGRRGTYLVRELVGVTLVDRLGGEEEGGTVLGSHRSC